MPGHCAQTCLRYYRVVRTPERGAQGSGPGGFEADGELGVKEGEVCWYLGRTVKKPLSSPAARAQRVVVSFF